MDTRYVVYPYNGMLLSLQKGNSDTWLNLEDVVLSEISQAQKDKECMIPLTGGTFGSGRDLGRGVCASWRPSVGLGRGKRSGGGGCTTA